MIKIDPRPVHAAIGVEHRLVRWFQFPSTQTRDQMEGDTVMEKMTTLEFLSQDEKTRMLHEARQQSLHDYASAIHNAKDRGRREVTARGSKQVARSGHRGVRGERDHRVVGTRDRRNSRSCRNNRGVLDKAGIRLLNGLSAPEKIRSRSEVASSIALAPFFIHGGAPNSGHGRLLSGIAPTSPFWGRRLVIGERQMAKGLGLPRWRTSPRRGGQINRLRFGNIRPNNEGFDT